MFEEAPPLRSGEVHVWRVSLDAPLLPVSELWAVLSDDEWRRAMCLRAQRDRERFVARRGLLRLVLDGYVRVGPERLRFVQGRHGKPALTGAGAAFSFNVSHSDSRALFAVACGGRVGIDVEAVRDDVDYERIAARFFSGRERAELMALPPPCRRLAFFHGWVRKEAYLKARGEGLTSPLERFSVSLSPHEAVRLVETTPDAQEPTAWSLRGIDPGSDQQGRGHVAALAVEAAGFRLRIF